MPAFFEDGPSLVAARLIALAVVVVLSVVANFIAKRLILRGVKALIKRSKYKWDDVLIQNNVLGRLSHIAPALVIYIMAPFALESGAAEQGAITLTLIEYTHRRFIFLKSLSLL